MRDVDTLIGELDPKLRVLAEKLRALVKKTLPNATEVVKWGNPVYTVNGKNAVWLLFYGGHVDLGFFKGAQLLAKGIKHSDLLEGTGKGLRHIKVRSEADIKEKEFTTLIKEAAKLV